MERDWRPSDAAARIQAEKAQPKVTSANKDAIFTSEESKNYDRNVVGSMDPARHAWTPHEPKVPEYDADARSEEDKPELYQ